MKFKVNAPFKNRILNPGVALIALIFALLFLIACQTPPEPTPAPTPNITMARFENEFGFDILYPAHWTTDLLRQGMMVFGLQETLFKGEAGPMVMVLRVPTAQVHGNLDGEFRHFLDFGPHRDGYTADGEVRSIEINGRPAFVVDMSFEGVEAEGEEFRLPMNAYIAGVEAQSGAVYIISGTAPTEQWPQNEQAIKVMVGSIELNE